MKYTTKQIAKLKSLAHHLKPVFQIGKEGFHEELIRDLLNYLNKHELMKVSVLQNCDFDMDEALEYFDYAGITLVQKIGRTLVLYKHSDEAKDPIKL